MTISEFTMHTGIKGFNQVKGLKEPNSSKECKRDVVNLYVSAQLHIFILSVFLRIQLSGLSSKLLLETINYF